MQEEIQAKIRAAKEQNLTKLDLSVPQYWQDKNNHKKLTEIPSEIFELTQLQVLNLEGHNLSTLPESIGNLTNLTCLYLSHNQLKNLPESITNFTKLTNLNLRYNQLTNLPESITQLTNLIDLDLRGNQLTNLPESITKFTNLTKLDLSNNQLTNIPESITKLTILIGLNFSGNQLTNIPESITKLTNLSNLNLNNNELKNLPEFITKLTNLTDLYLGYNQLKNIPESITKLTNLKDFYLSGNPLKSPPIEIYDRGIEAIRKYFSDIEKEGAVNVYEAKFIIVGEGEAGKTSLMNKILDPTYAVPQTEKATHGIDIKTFYFSDKKDEIEYRVNMWDFGGQEIYHQIHQFFLTQRTLYALVTDSRKDHQHLDYWLQIVELLRENSSLLIIKNEKDCCVDIKDESQIRSRFKAMVKEILDTNLANNKGLEKIISRVKEYIQELPYTGIKMAKSWAKVREAIEDEATKRDYISLEEYLKICDDCGYTKTNLPISEDENEQSKSLNLLPPFSRGVGGDNHPLENEKQSKDGRLILSQFFHDLGIILHFQDDEQSHLYDTVILNPTWGTQAVYELLKQEDNPVKNNLGKFTFKNLKTIWSDARYKDKYRELLDLMKRFNLCYEIPNSQPKTYIAPQLLNTNAPNYYWDNEENLCLIYRYEFMPKGILSNFIVRMHHYIEDSKVWCYGVILTYQNTLAEVIETYNKKEIKIKLQGINKRGLSEIIIKEFDEINKTYHNLKVDLLIPCNCRTCKKSNTTLFTLAELRERLQYKKMTIECRQPPYEYINILSLIDDSIGREQFNRSNKDDNSTDDNSTNVTNIKNEITIQNHSGNGGNTATDSNTVNNI